MKHVFSIIAILWGINLLVSAQKSKVLSVFQLVETGKYEDAREAIEEAIGDDKTWNWPTTWYARGMLCQTAYEKGMADNDRKKYELYPDQLYVAFDSYEKALTLDTRDRLDAQIARQYVPLANDFQRMGEKHYKRQEYEKALRAYEHALKISRSPILSVALDTNLVYNAALSAYASSEWDKAIGYLSGLYKSSRSANVSLLLFQSYLENEDTISAENVLLYGIDHHKSNDTIVLKLVDLYLQASQPEHAIAILDSAAAELPDNYKFPYTRGLVYQKTEQYDEAIEAYKKALQLAPNEIMILSNLGTCYYNIGVEIEEKTLAISNNRDFTEEKKKSKAAFENAIEWFEKAYDKDPDNQETIIKLYQLYKVLKITDKINSLETMVD